MRHSKVFVSLELRLVKSVTNLQQCCVSVVAVANLPHRHGKTRGGTGKNGCFLWRGLRIRSWVFHKHHQKAQPLHVLGDCDAGNQN